MEHSPNSIRFYIVIFTQGKRARKLGTQRLKDSHLLLVAVLGCSQFCWRCSPTLSPDPSS